MAWVRLDDGFAQHPKLKKAGPLGIAMQVAGLCYCNQYLTDGYIPASVVPTLLHLEGLAMNAWKGEIVGGAEDAKWELIVDELIAAKVWRKSNGGYRIHDYKKYQPSKRDVLEERENSRKRQQKHRSVSRRDKNVTNA